jgi:hypothetical protein
LLISELDFSGSAFVMWSFISYRISKSIPHSMAEGHFWKTDRCSTGQKIYCFLYNLNVHLCVHNSPSLEPLLPISVQSTPFTLFLKPNVVAEWLTLLLRIREVSDLNLGPETGYLDWGFSWFSSVRPHKCRYSTSKLGHCRFHPHPFQFVIYQSSFHSTLYGQSYWQYSQFYRHFYIGAINSIPPTAVKMLHHSVQNS